MILFHSHVKEGVSDVELNRLEFGDEEQFEIKKHILYEFIAPESTSKLALTKTFDFPSVRGYNKLLLDTFISDTLGYPITIDYIYSGRSFVGIVQKYSFSAFHKTHATQRRKNVQGVFVFEEITDRNYYDITMEIYIIQELEIHD